MCAVPSCPDNRDNNDDDDGMCVTTELMTFLMTRGVTVSASAFLACHQCGFESRLGLESLGFSMWHFLKLVSRGFLLVLQFPPLLHRLTVQPIK